MKTKQAPAPKVRSAKVLDQKRRRAYVKVTDAMAAYLEAVGWRAIVAGEVSIEQGARPLMFYFRIKFTGGRSKDTE